MVLENVKVSGGNIGALNKAILSLYFQRLAHDQYREASFSDCLPLMSKVMFISCSIN